MKKILTSLSIFLAIGLMVCFIAGLCVPVPAEVPQKSTFAYKMCNFVKYFLVFMPALFMTGFVVTCSVNFGRNSEGSTRRFSQAMFGRFKVVIISSLIITLLLTLSNEVFGVLVNRTQQNIINKPKIIQEYLKVGNNLYDRGFYDRSLAYANTVLTLDPNSTEARDLKSKADLEINRINKNSLKFDLTNSQPLIEKDDSPNVDGEKIGEAYRYFNMAREAFDSSQWFYAHYYAETALRYVTSLDPNYEDIKRLSTQAWNNLSTVHTFEKSEEQFFFEQKFKGYKALMEKDELQAYYIFQYLIMNYPEMERDNDVNFYYEIAKSRIEQKYFFMDETFELSSFEDYNDVHFSYTFLNNEKAVVYFKGLTSVKATGQTVQYLRDLYIVYLDTEGNWKYTIHTPYAKLMPVSVENINAITKNMLGISDETSTVPYILLKSISRDDSDYVCSPVYTYADGRVVEDVSDYLLFPMEYKDFLMIENSPEEPENSSILSLIKFATRSDDFGYSSVRYIQVLMNRLLFPLYVLCMFILLGAFGWNNRIGATQYFKFSWIFGFPVFILIAAIGYRVFMFFFKLMNYAFIGLVGGISGIWVAMVFYIILFLIVSLYFMARHTEV